MERLIHGKYQLLSRIQSGGFGTTWLALDTMLNLQVAVKEYESTDERRKQQFLEEARHLAKFSGEPGIVNVRDFLEDDGKIYLIMEYLDGEDLKTYVENKGKLPFNQAYQLLRPIMFTLDKLHHEGMIHRDVSPENIRMLSNGQLKLLDFGSALEIEDRYTNEKTMTVMVKPGYAPQEQYMNKAMQGAWTDVYAVCATLYKCITGNTPMDSLQRSFYDELEKPSILDSDISPEQETVLFQGLALKKEERISSMHELIELFDQTMNTKNEKIEESKAEMLKNGGWNRENSITTDKNVNRGKRKIGKEKIAAAILSVLGIVAAVAIGMIMFFNDPYRESDSSMVDIKDMDVNQNMLDKVARDSKAERLRLYNCTLDDEGLETIAKMKNITCVSLIECTGYTGLAPLAKMNNLEKLEVEGDYSDHSKVLSGEKLFTMELPQVTSLSVDNIVFKDQGECLRNFKNLEELHLSGNEGLVNMEFLKDMTELTLLRIYAEDASSISSSLVNCTKLTYCSFNETGMNDLSWAANCTALEELCINNCGVTDIAPLASCTELNRLEAGNNQINDISSLQSCSKLSRVSLENNQIRDISPLQGCNELSYLTLSNNQIESLESLAGKEKISDLEIDSNKVSSLEPLENSTRVISLNASHNQITDIMPLKDCSELQFLWLDDNQLVNLNGCEMMLKMNTLSAADNQLTDVTGLTNASSIEKLNLENNQIKGDLSWMGNFTELEMLNISRNQISSIQGIENNTNMEILIADQNQITDSLALENMTSLKVACLSQNQIGSLKGLENKNSLTALLAAHNQIEDISALETSISQLMYLDLGSNFIKDVRVLSKMSGEKLVLLDNNLISDISMLPKDVQYGGLTLHGNPIKDLSVFEKIKDVNSDWDTVYFSYAEGLRAEYFSNYGNTELHIVDVPADQQAAILREIKAAINTWGAGEPIFQTTEQADEEVDSFREKLYNTALGRSSEEGSDVEQSAEEEASDGE